MAYEENYKLKSVDCKTQSPFICQFNPGLFIFIKRFIVRLGLSSFFYFIKRFIVSLGYPIPKYRCTQERGEGGTT